jgi:hypothetical protein
VFLFYLVPWKRNHSRTLVAMAPQATSLALSRPVYPPSTASLSCRFNVLKCIIEFLSFEVSERWTL